MSKVFPQETLNITGLQRPELIVVVAKMVRSGVAKDVDEAFLMLEKMEHDPKEVLKAVEESYMTKKPKSETEEDTVDIR
tara:strand:- start:368 stop:604 length:237 start_codon:yes stop_codon:yes gene_type:complete